MAIRDNLYNQLSDMEKRYYDQQFSQNYVPGQENIMLTSQPNYNLMQSVYEAEQNVPESDWWNPASWNLFGSAEGSEPEKYGLVNTDIASMYSPDMKKTIFGDENYLGNNQTNNIMADLAAENKNWFNSVNQGIVPGDQIPLLPDPNVLSGSVTDKVDDKKSSWLDWVSAVLPGGDLDTSWAKDQADNLVDRTTRGSDTAFANPDLRFGNYPGKTFPYDDTPTTSEKIIAAKNYNTGTPPEWMVGADPMGKGRYLGEDAIGEVWGTPPKSQFAESMGNILSKAPSLGILKNLSQGLPINERAIMEGNLRNQGIYTDDIGRIVQAGSDYNDPRNVMAGYNPIKMTDKTFTKRTDRIEKTLRDKYGLTDQDIADINAGTFDQSKFDFDTKLIDRYKNIKQSGKVIMQQKEFAKKMADQRRENKKANRALVKQKQMTRAQDREDRRNIQQIQQYTGRPLSTYRMSRPASERRYTGHGKSGMGRDRSELMAYGGRVGYANGGLASLFTRRG